MWRPAVNSVIYGHSIDTFYISDNTLMFLLRSSKNRQEFWRAAHLQNLHFEVCQCFHTNHLHCFLQGQVCASSLDFMLFNQAWMILFFILYYPHLPTPHPPNRLVGRPGSYLYVFESYRMEEVRHTNMNGSVLWAIKSYWGGKLCPHHQKLCLLHSPL